MFAFHLHEQITVHKDSTVSRIIFIFTNQSRNLAVTERYRLIVNVFVMFSEVANVEKQPKLEGRSMQMFLAPKPTK